MHQQSARQLQSQLTSLSVSDVLDRATQFFARGGGVYAAFVEKRSATHVALRGQGNEEIVIGAREVPEGTSVSGASYLFDQQIARFLTSLPPVATLVPETSSAPAAITDGGAV